jgi:DNA-binding transcriptional MerR regulator/methylmalonyl-CoA mutase cobalamin-binding subunit
MVVKVTPTRSIPPPSREGEGSTIRVVSRATGLSMETLRAWERRYGFPLPERREGSNRRLYSSADVAKLQLIQEAIKQGYRIGDIVGKTDAELTSLSRGDTRAMADVVSLRAVGEASVEDLVALLRADRVAKLESELRRAAVTLGPRRFVTDIAHPLAVRVGAAWAEGMLSIRHEHAATECLVTQLRQMLAEYRDIETRPVVLLATLSSEPHTLPLQMVALYLVTLGATPRLLGGPTPARDVVEAALSFGADVVGLTVTPTADLETTRAEMRVLLRDLPADAVVWIGGGAVSSLACRDPRVRTVTLWSELDEAAREVRGGRLAAYHRAPASAAGGRQRR